MRVPLLASCLCISAALTASACARPAPPKASAPASARVSALTPTLTPTPTPTPTLTPTPALTLTLTPTLTPTPTPPAPSPLSTLFDGDPAPGPIKLTDSRCGPGCLFFPKGWLSTDDNGWVYAWFFRGIGQFGTAEVMRSPLPKLDDAGIALRLRFAGGENVTWAAPIEGTVGQDHAKALIAEGTGTSRGRKAHFWYAYVELPHRKDLIIAYVVDGEPPERTDETIAVVRSVRFADGRVPDK